MVTKKILKVGEWHFYSFLTIRSVFVKPFLLPHVAGTPAHNTQLRVYAVLRGR